MKRIADHKIPIAGSFIVLSIFGAMLYFSAKTTREANCSAQWVAHTQEVLFNSEKLLLSAINIETCERAFLLTGLPLFQQNFVTSKRDAAGEIITLRSLTKDNSRQQPKLDSLAELIRKWTVFSDSIINARPNISPIMALRIVQHGQGKIFTNNVELIVEAIQHEERQLLATRKADNKNAITLQRQLFIFSVTLMLVLLTFILWKEKGQALKREKERSNIFFHDLIESSPDAVVVIDDHGKIVLLNQEAESMFQYSRDELTKKDIRAIIPLGFNWVATKTIAEYDAIKQNGKHFIAEISLTSVTSIEGHVLSASVRDISERKKYERQLIKSEEKFRLLVSSVKDYAIFMLDADGCVISWNSGAAEIKGYSETEIIGKPIEIFYTQEDVDRGAPRRNLAIARKDGSYEQEGWRVRKDRSKFFADVVFTALFDEQRNLYGYAIVARDITELKQIHQSLTRSNEDSEERVKARTLQLAASEIRFRALIENSAEGISLTNASRQVIYRSPAADRITGGWPLGSPMQYCHPDDAASVLAAGEYALANPTTPVEFQGRFLNMAGDYFWMEGTLTNLLNLKGVEALVTNFRDITSRKEAEQQLIKSEKIYKTVAASIPGSLICLLDTNYRYLLAEGDMLEKLGYSKKHLVGNTADKILPPDIYEGIKNDFDGALTGKTIVCEVRRGELDVLSKFVPLKDEHGAVYAIMTFAFDVTALKDAQRFASQTNEDLEEKIAIRTRELNRTNDELEAFSYSVSHDLRAPLRSVIGFSAILEEDYGSKLDEEARRITSVIKNSATKMGQLIDDLLEFSRIGRQELRKTLVNTSAMVEEIIAELKAQTDDCNAQWLVHPLPDIRADIRSIKQVWLNLLSNALKYSRKINQPIIEIGGSFEEDAVIFYVRDNGAGFNDKFSDKLFKVFQRLHSSKDFEGTGVGLAIVDKIIARHGGKVWADGAVNEGATFFFSLPSCNPTITYEPQ